MPTGPERRDEPQVFRYQGVAAGLRQPSVTVPPGLEVPAEVVELAPEPLLSRRRTGLWGVLIGVLVVGGGATAAVLASAESVLPEREMAPAPVPSQAPEPENVVSVSAPPAANPAVEAAPVQAAPPVVVPVVVDQPVGAEKKISRARSKVPAPVKPATPTSEVTLSRFSATGSMSAAEVRAGLLPSLGRLRDCHNTALQRGQNITGTIAVNLEIRGSSVESIDVKTAIDSIALRGCFRKVLVGTVFAGGSGAHTQAKVEFFLLARPGSR